MTISATIGVLCFNNGNEELASMQKEFGLRVGCKTVEHAKRKDDMRMKCVLRKSADRKSRQHWRVTDRQRHIQKEGVTYAAGRFGLS